MLLCIISMQVQAQQDSITNQYFKQDVIQFMDSIAAAQHIDNRQYYRNRVMPLYKTENSLQPRVMDWLILMKIDRSVLTPRSGLLLSQKLVTATAVMQLHSKGLIDLHRDILILFA